MNVDYIIIGQGICGTWMSYYLLQEGCSVLVIDEDRPFSSSKVASGIINPVTGKRIATTWLADKLMPFAWDAYTQLGNHLGNPLITQHDILEFHPTRESREVFDNKLEEGNPYLKHAIEDTWQPHFRFNYGVGQINPCWLVDVQLLLAQWRKELMRHNALLSEKFDWQYCTITADSVTYKDITARKIIFCDGVDGFDNPYFSLLPYTRNKGEALIVSIPNLPRTHIYKQGIKIVPWKDNLFWVGASFEWTFSHPHPTQVYQDKLTSQLNYWLRHSYTVQEHIASERPVTVERMPFVGVHPTNTSVGLLNGMGTKGCSLAPYLAQQFAQHLVYGTPLQPETDVARHKRVLSR